MIGVLDTETTGIGDADEVVEVAVVRLGLGGGIVDTFTSLVRPRVPVTIPARAVHHIAPAEIESAPAIADVAVAIPPFAVVAGHSVDFDLRLLRQSLLPLPTSQTPPGQPDAANPAPIQSIASPTDPLLPSPILDLPAIDTYRCARHLFPDSPGFSNQVLRYYLELEVDLRNMVPHRALPDAIVTAAILGRMLEEAPIDHLVDLTMTPVLLSVVGFGKHRGKKWAELDIKYLAWVATAPDMDPDVVYTAKAILAERREKREALP